MAKARITLIGLGVTGNSIGLALRAGTRDYEVIGHDKDMAAVNEAKRLASVDKLEWNLINACDGAGLIILALPFAAIHDTLAALAGELSEGAVILDTAGLKQPVQAWADALLPATVAYIGTHPIVPANDHEPSAELFDKCLWALCPATHTEERAVQVANDLVLRLGAKPLFLDALEHDGLMAAVEQMPALYSNALLHSITTQPAWRELRKVAGGPFEQLTSAASATPESLIEAWQTNQPHLLHALDTVLATLTTWRDLLAAGDAAALQAPLEEAAQARTEWLNARSRQEWEDNAAPVSQPPGMIKILLGKGRQRKDYGRRAGSAADTRSA